MIEGIKIDLPGTEVKELYQKKAACHAERMAFYRQQFNVMKDSRDAIQVPSNKSRRDLLEELQSSVIEHEQGRTFSEFMAAHTVVSETYRITRNDLHALGVLGAPQYG